MNITRREILRFVGGSALGLLLTPIPWKALDDSAVWTQNWPWIPEPRRGDISFKLTTCSLCPAACGMRVRCVGNQPVSLSGIQTHPLSQGALCPMGIVAHHLRYHPARVSRPLRIIQKNGSSRSTAMTFDEALDDISFAMKDARVSSQTIAVVDGRPGRTASHLFRQFAAQVPYGRYISYSEVSLDVLGSMFEKPIGPLGYDLDHAQVIVSFGVPLCDCWGTPARTARYLGKKFEGKQKLLQIEAYRSRTSEMADRWIPIRPGTDAAFALGMAHVILKEKLSQAKSKDLSEFESIVSTFSPSVVAEVCGVSEDTIVETARVFSMSKPSVAVIDGLTNSREAQAAVMILNLLVGNVGWKGGVAVRREVPTGLADIKNTESINSNMYSIPDHSIRVMLIDESLSGCQLSDTLLQKKLAENGIVVSLSPFVTERPFCAQYVIPTPVFLESLTDLSSPHDSESSSMSISFPLVPSPTGVVDPIYFIQRLASAAGVVNIESGTMEELVKRRAGVLYGEKRGTVFNASTGQLSGVRNLLSTDDMWNALITGGCWIDSAEIVKSFPAFRLSAFLSKVDINKLQSGKNQLVLVPFIEKTVYSNSEISPLMSKVGQESGLRPFGCRAYLNPTTAEVIGIHEGCRIVLQTNKGSMEAEARYDASIMPGIVGVSNTTHPQNFIALCEMNDNAAICPTPVKIQKV